SAARALWRSLSPPERTVIIGSGPVVASVERKLPVAAGARIVVVGAAEPPPADAARDQRLERFGKVTGDARRIIVAPTDVSEGLIGELRVLCRERQVKLTAISPLQGRALPASRITEVADMPMLEFDTWDVSRSTIFIKRAFDVVFSATLLIVLAPVFLVIA